MSVFAVTSHNESMDVSTLNASQSFKMMTPKELKVAFFDLQFNSRTPE